MKFSKFIALALAVCMMLVMAVSCNNSGNNTTSTSGEPAGTKDPSESTSEAAKFLSTILIVAKYTAEDGTKVDEILVDEEDIVYNGIKPLDALTMFDLISVYCEDNEIPCTLDNDGHLESITGESGTVYTVANGGYIWSYQIDGKDATDYDAVLTSGVVINVTFTTYTG